MTLTVQGCIDNFKNTDIDAKSVKSIWNYCTTSVWCELSDLRCKYLISGDVEKSDFIREIMNSLESIKEQK